MSPRASRPGLRRAIAWSCAVLSGTGQAQTIADYSRAQRSVLENAMMQATARSAGLAASAPAVPAQPAPTPLVAAVPDARAGRDPVAPDPRVSGVFASAAGVLTEVDVNGTPYLLVAGQAVPGTAWRVESVAVDRVVLSRRDVAAMGAAAEPVRRVFALPPLH